MHEIGKMGGGQESAVGSHLLAGIDYGTFHDGAFFRLVRFVAPKAANVSGCFKNNGLQAMVKCLSGHGKVIN